MPNLEKNVPIKVLYFTAVPLGLDNNGGSLCCRSHVQRMAADKSLDLTVVVAGRRQINEDAAAHLKPYTENIVPIDLHDSNFRLLRKFRKIKATLNKLIADLPLGDLRYRHPHVDEDFAAIVKKIDPEIIVVDYLPSIHLVPRIGKLGKPVCVITLNPETEFIKDSLAGKSETIKEWLRSYRTRRFEEKVFSQCLGIAALNKNDLPGNSGSNAVLAVIPPYFDERPERWTYQGNRRIFFVGNFKHYPNYRAADWISNRLAPEIFRLDPTVRFSIIGGYADDIRVSWNASNIDFLGVSDKATVQQNFTNADLFIAPIENNFGSKIKLLDALSHGTPFLASGNAMSGLPFLSEIPQIDLNNPNGTAKQILSLLDTPGALNEISERVATAFTGFRQSQNGIWGDFFRQVLKRREDGDFILEAAK